MHFNFEFKMGDSMFTVHCILPSVATLKHAVMRYCTRTLLQTRQKVLVTAFLRGLKDPFPPARIAAIGSMGATHAFYSTSDLACRILPAVCTLAIDKEKEVRDQAFQTIKFFLAKLEKLSEDPQAAAEQEKIEGT